MEQKTALITGYTGQDGTFLTQLLLEKGYKVIGLVRRVSTEPPHRVRGNFDFSEALQSGQLVLEMGDLLSVDSLIRIIDKHKPYEIYNLAAQSDVHISFLQPEFTIESTFLGVVNIITALEGVYGRHTPGKMARWKMYQASTSEMFGDRTREIKNMDELTRFEPNSPYAISKAAAHYYCKYKRAEGNFVSCGILFNHESEIRGGNFVTQKIVQAAVRIHRNIQTANRLEIKPGFKPMELGNLDSVRDWGYAGDYVEAMWLMLQQSVPDDFVISTGKGHTVRDFVGATFLALQHEITWIGEGKRTKGYVDNQLAVVVSDKYWRPVDVRYLKGDSCHANKTLGWDPKVNFDKLVEIMVDEQLSRIKI